MGRRGGLYPRVQRLLVHEKHVEILGIDDADDFRDLERGHLRGRVSLPYGLQHGSSRGLIHS